MATDEAFLSRFMASASALPPDVAAWAEGKLIATLPPSRRRAARDRLLREAAALLPAAPTKTKARLIRAQALQLRRALPARPDRSTPRGCVAAAMLLDLGRVLSLKQLQRVLGRGTFTL